MRHSGLVLLAVMLNFGMAQAQVINGQSTDDAAYAPRPPARWHAPEASGEVPGGSPADRPDDEGFRQPRSEIPHGE